MSATGISSEDVLVRVQETPNPSAFKFICNQALKNEGKATFHHPDELPGLTLVRSLFDVPGVKQLHLFRNTLTVTHDRSMSDDNLTESVTSVLKTRIPIHDPDFQTAEELGQKTTAAKKDRSGLSEELVKIEEILDRTIRPGLQADGGDIDVLGFENNELKILYQGACGGCPSAMMGTLDAIQGILRQELGNDELIVIPS